MKVLLLLSTSSVTGPAELCLEDAKGLRKAGHEVLFGCDTRRPGNYPEAIKNAGFELMDELTLCPKPTAAELFKDVTRLRARLKSANLVHCRFAHDHSIALIARQALSNRPALVRTAEIARSLAPGFARGYSLRACDALVVSCSEYARRLVEVHKIPPQKTHVLSGQIDAQKFAPGESSFRTELGVSSDELLFGIVSRIKQDRLHETVVRGFAQVAGELPNAKLAVVGRGEHEPAIRRLVDELGLNDRVIFAGYRTGDRLIDAYRGFDVKIWMSEGNDGTCRAVLEAMGCGKPVIVGNEGAMAEMVCNGEDGLVISRTESSVARAIKAMSDGERRSRMGFSARERAMQFTSTARLQGLLRIYESALGTIP